MSESTEALGERVIDELRQDGLAPKTSSLQAGLDAVNAQPVATDSDALIAAKCRALLKGYAARWPEDEYTPLQIETTVTSDLYNPATSRKSRILTTAGKLDVIAIRKGVGVFSGQQGEKKVLIDHKTTSDDIADPAGTFWRQLVVESQPSHYMLLEWLNGEKLDEAVWDVLRKPRISPKKFTTKAEKASIIANRRYCNQAVSDETLLFLQTSDRENLELYEARLLQECLDEPTKYFQRRTVPRLDSELMDYAADLWDAGQLVIEARRLHRWPKHPSSCMSWGRPCSFLGICSGFDRPDSDKWARRAAVHSELPDLAGDGRDTLTFSSIRTFQSCPRKFYFRYQEGLERIEEEEAEALRFGHVWHIGLESFWRAMMPAQPEEATPVPAQEPVPF